MAAYQYPHRPVQCFVCGDALEWVFDPAVRDTCHKCGGTAQVEDAAVTRETVRRYGIERIREAKRHKAEA